MKSLTRRARVLVAFGAVAATAAAVLVVGQGYQASQVRMRSGAVWLASNQTGHTAFVDGTTAEVRSQLKVASPNSPLSVSQRGSTAHVLNRTTGELRRVDGATEEVSEPVTLLPAADELVLMSAPGVLRGVDVHSGLVASVDPGTLEPRGEPTPLDARITADGLAADSGGRLWAIDHETGDLVWLNGEERRTRPAATRPGSSRLTTVQGRPVVVDPERGTAELLDAETGAVARSVRPDLHAGDAVAVSGSSDRSRVLIANRTRGTLVACTFDTGSCAAPVTVSAAGSDLGAPVEVEDHAVVPDLSKGQATIVDLASSRVVAQRQLFDQPTRFELIARDGIVFFNDPDSSRAGVLDLSGGVRTIVKYTEDHSEGDVEPVPGRPAPADQVTKVGNDKPKPGLGLPGQNGQLPRETPPSTPAPAASIVVRPSSQGVVGDEFELTLVLQPSTGIATTRWWFGDGTEAVGTTVRHRWQQPGSFTVRAAATLASGAQAQPAETTVTVDPPGAPPRITRLTVQRPKPVIGETVHFSADATGEVDKWTWTVVRSGSSTPEVIVHAPEFRHVFTVPGTYAVNLTITAGTRTVQANHQLNVARGVVKAWGLNDLGQTEAPPATQSSVVAADAGDYHSLALKADGSVVAWGYDTEGEALVPEEAASDVIAVAAGAHHNLVLKKDHSVVAWGADFFGETRVPREAMRGVTAVAAGSMHSLVLKADGSVIGWGYNDFGQTTIPLAAKSGVIAIAAGDGHSVALKSDGSVVVWGDNRGGQTVVPQEAKSGVVAISSMGWHVLALKSDGSVIGWGDNEHGQIDIPPAAKSGVTAVDAGMVYGLALKGDGSVVAWGPDWNGESSVPPGLSGGVLAVIGGQGFSLAIV